MKLSEIKVGDDYAVKKYGTHYRMRCIEVGEFTYTQFRGSRDYKGHTAKARGARMQFVRDDGTLRTDGNAEWVRAQQVEHTWETQQRLTNARQTAEAVRTAAIAELNEALKTAGCKYATAYTNRDTGYITISLSSSDVTALTAALTEEKSNA